MALVWRFVDKKGFIVERFLGIMHVTETTTLSLKSAINDLLTRHKLSLSQVRGQGYDGASNMSGKFNGLKSLILKENNTAYYVHCFAHQLQLTLVAIAKNHIEISLLFHLISNITNVVGASCKTHDMIREKHAFRIVEALINGERESGRRLNQEINLKIAGDTRWGSHYGSILRLIDMYSSVIDVLEDTEEEGSVSEKRAGARILLEYMQSFDFIFNLHLMKSILGITNELCVLLQRKDQDIVNAIKQVNICKKRIQDLRDDGWKPLLDEVSLFCQKLDILVPIMADTFKARGRSRRKVERVTNLHHYRVEIFNTLVDMQLQELNSCFTEMNMKLLLSVACLSPSNSFVAFDKEKLIVLAEYYPSDFSKVDILALDNQLENYICNVRSDEEFRDLNEIGDLAPKMVETKKDKVYPLVYKLLKFALLLPVATATVERAFSAMKYIKNRLRNKMSDEWMNDCLISYIEKDVFDQVSNEAIMKCFQGMKDRRGDLGEF